MQTRGRRDKATAANTRLVHWLADVHFELFAPAFTLSIGDSEAPAHRRMPIASVVTANFKKNMKTYIVDAFTKIPYAGNPAGVCILDYELPDNLMAKYYNYYDQE